MNSTLVAGSLTSSGTRFTVLSLDGCHARLQYHGGKHKRLFPPLRNVRGKTRSKGAMDLPLSVRAKHRWHPCKLYLKSHILIFFANPRNFSGPHLNTGVCSHVRRALPSGGQMNIFAYCRSKPDCESVGYEQALANPRAAVAPWITTRRTLSAEASPLGAQHRTKTGPSRA
jgi:hypothetical protein